MTTKDNGDTPAFPVTAGQQVYATGISMRDWFAGQALAGMLGDSEVIAEPPILASVSYAYADAMIAARKGGTE